MAYVEQNLTGLPFVLRACNLSVSKNSAFPKDVPTGNDPLPRALEVNTEGYVLSRRTMTTDMKRETTDDN
jgi:hypothetical protein